MNTLNSMIGDIEAEITGKSSSSKHNKMHLRLQQRSARKCVTIFEGIHADLNIKDILKEMRKKFSCGGAKKVDEDGNNVIILFGDQRRNIIDYLVNKNIADADDFVMHGY